jgi:hypothetical protein
MSPRGRVNPHRRRAAMLLRSIPALSRRDRGEARIHINDLIRVEIGLRPRSAIAAAGEPSNVTPARVATRVLLLLTAAFLVDNLGVRAAIAQGKLDARYSASLGGIPIGRGAWVIDIADSQYTAAASGMTTGLVRLFASGQGSSAARGLVRNGYLFPSTYASNIVSDQKSEDLRIVLQNGAVKDVSINPPTLFHPDRIPVPDSHRRGVVDPMTAALIRVTGSGDPISSQACNRTIAIFDGRMRYDLKLSFKRFEAVRASRGYVGPVVVCAVQFTPISGYVPHRPSITYLRAQRDVEIWLAPVAGTRVLVPYKFLLPTPFGLGVLEATQFVSVPNSTRATPTSARVQ